jgi:DNA polymerase-3 subunit delta'
MSTDPVFNEKLSRLVLYYAFSLSWNHTHMFFKDIIGQEEIKKTLRQMVANDKLAHALLLSGKQGVGHLGLALALASYVLCQNRSPLDSCGECAHCKRSHQNLHPDIHYTFPVIKKGEKKREETFSNDYLVEWRKLLASDIYFTESDWLKHLGAGNKQGDINKKECLEIVRALSLKSFTTSQKILVLWLPEYLGKNGNRLLKLIEEPPDDTYIIMVTNKQEKILNTILSRCQMIVVPSIQDEELTKYALDVYNRSEQETQKAVFMADGDISILKVLMAGELHTDVSEAFFNWIKISFKGDKQEIVNWVDVFHRSNKEWQKQFFRFGLSFFRELLVSQYTGFENSKLSDKEVKFGQQILKVLNLEKISLLQEKLDNCIYAVERNIHAKLLMMACSLFVGRVLRKKEEKEFIH